MDVASLYTNIPNDGGLLAAKTVLDNYRMGRQKPKNSSLCQLLEMVLTMNNFDFAGRHYLQVGGTAMGTKVAPSFANTYMGWFENQHVYTYPLQPLIWVRFIDDIFQIWTHGVEEFKKFEHHLNHCVDSIKFETDISSESVHFLDVTVSINDRGEINTSLYTKPTDAHNYLSYFSCHPRNCRDAIPYSQFLRIRRICNDMDDFVFHARSPAKDFLRAKYPREIIQKAFTRAFDLNREDLLKSKLKGVEKKEDNIFLITTHHPGGRLLNNIIQQNRDILDGSSSTRTVLKWKVTQGFRRPRNIRDHLVRARFSNPMDVVQLQPKNPSKSSNRCQRQNCRYCVCLNRSGRITSPITKHSYNTPSDVVAVRPTTLYTVYNVKNVANNMLAIIKEPCVIECANISDLSHRTRSTTVWADTSTYPVIQG